MREYEKILKALANKRRLQIIKFLKEKKQANVGEISDHIKLSFKATSKHLAVLSGADLLEKEQKSLSMYYFLAPKLPPMANAIISII
ncbi:MAG: arsR-type protein [Patescibacteria group bacterium]|jgi:DNA-binding transcriptional ArsR family regulator|nr:arsR-type protein [Patescibacteria group bacterium]